jgi:hypothetical protein
MTNSRKLPSQPSSKLSQEVRGLAYREMLRQVQQIHNFTVVAMSTPIVVALAGCYFVFNGQAEGSSITAVGTIATTICIPFSKVVSQESNRKLIRLMKEAKELI